MKITLCGSIAFIDEFYELKAELESRGHSVSLPPQNVDVDGEEMPVSEFYSRRKSGDPGEAVFEVKEDLMHRHYENIRGSDAVLVINRDKNGIQGYIGGNTFIEMGVAHFLGKKIYLTNEIPTWHTPKKSGR